MTATGKCLCGIVKYELRSLPLTSGVCHCKNCQRSGGSAFSTVAAVNKNDLVIMEGELKLYSDPTQTLVTLCRDFFVKNVAHLYIQLFQVRQISFI